MLALTSAIKLLIIRPWKCRSRSPFTKITECQLLHTRCLQNFDRNDITVASNKNIISADLKKLVKVTIYKPIIYRLLFDRFEPNCHRNDATNADFLCYLNSIWTKFSWRMMTPLPELSRLCVQALISLPYVTASSTRMHPTNQPFISSSPLSLIFINVSVCLQSILKILINK